MDEKAKRWNRALASVYFWAHQETDSPPALPDGASLQKMSDALSTLAGESDQGAQAALRLAYVEAMRVHARLDQASKDALHAIASRIDLTSTIHEDALKTVDPDERVVGLLSTMKPRRQVKAYRVTKVGP